MQGGNPLRTLSRIFLACLPTASDSWAPALLIANGAPVDARNTQGRTPLALADELTGGDVADVLIRNGATR